MRIAYVASIEAPIAVKKTAKELKIEKCRLMVANQRILDRKRAEKLFEVRLNNIKIKLKKLGL